MLCLACALREGSPRLLLQSLASLPVLASSLYQEVFSFLHLRVCLTCITHMLDHSILGRIQFS